MLALIPLALVYIGARLSHRQAVKDNDNGSERNILHGFDRARDDGGRESDSTAKADRGISEPKPADAAGSTSSATPAGDVTPAAPPAPKVSTGANAGRRQSNGRFVKKTI